MLKLIELDSSYFHDEPNIRVVDPGNSKGLVKAAADSAVMEFVNGLRPEHNKIYVHILAMGASEFYGSNRNGDSFPEQNLIDYHKTFESSPAHIFRNHVNKDPGIAIGQVVFATYNRRMHRVEVVAWIDREKGADIAERIEAGDFPKTSMACKTPYDVCAICGNQAHTRQEYCEHLTSELGRIYPDGRKVSALNVAPLKFFDMSVVIRPADVTSSVLQKVASANHVVGSAEMAEIEGLAEKTASHRKLSELIKEIDGGHIVDSSDNLLQMLDKVRDPHAETIAKLNKYDLGTVLATMAHLGISPSVGYLADLIGHSIAGDAGIGVGDLVEGYIGANGLGDITLPDTGDSSSKAHPSVVEILSPHVKTASLLPEYVAQRAVSYGHETYIPGTNVGYINTGRHIEELPKDRFARLSSAPEAHQPGGIMTMLKTLVMIGGAALAAKWYITREIERKSQEIANAHNSGVKIVLVKSATDYCSTYRLAKIAMVRALGKV